MSKEEALPFDLAGRRIYVAGHGGMVGGAIVRRLQSEGCSVVTADRRALDLTRQSDVEAWLDQAKPDVVVVAAARVGGIAYNNAYPVDFLAAVQRRIVGQAPEHRIAAMWSVAAGTARGSGRGW